MSAVGACKAAKQTKDTKDFLRARCEVGGQGRDCRVSDLDSNGLFVESFVPALTGSKVILHFRLPNGHQISADGIVSRHEFSVGFNVNFTGLSARDRDQIASIA